MLSSVCFMFFTQVSHLQPECQSEQVLAVLSSALPVAASHESPSAVLRTERRADAHSARFRCRLPRGPSQHRRRWSCSCRRRRHQVQNEADWIKQQAMTSLDYAVDSKIWGFLSGGLNMQASLAPLHPQEPPSEYPRSTLGVPSEYKSTSRVLSTPRPPPRAPRRLPHTYGTCDAHTSAGTNGATCTARRSAATCACGRSV